MMYQKSAGELREGFVSGSYTATQIASYFLERIENLDQDLSAFLSVVTERVMQKAKELDEKKAQGKPLGKLAGIPVAVKDNIHIEGEITTCASHFLSNYKAPFDATVVKLMEAEDALILGKTNLDEFAMGSSTENSAFQTTKNPWNLAYCPGGSSGGSAAAVSGRLIPLALGSDTGGSIRQPASFTGTVGFKPTYGRVSRFGLVAFGSSLDQIGPLANCVEDVARIMEVIGAHCDYDSTSLDVASENYLDHLSAPLKGKRVGVPWKFLKNVAKEFENSPFHQGLKVLEELGVQIVDVDLDKIKYSIPVYYILSTAEASTNLARFDGIRFGKRSERATSIDEVYDLSREEGFGDEVKRRIMLGTFVLSSGYQEAYYKKAQKVRSLLIRQFDEAFKKCDIVAMPTAPTSAFKINSICDPINMYLQDLYTICANLGRLPSISLPTHLDQNRLPQSIQLLGPQLSDKSLLNFAFQFEKARGFSNFLPPLFDKEVNQ